MFSSLWPVVYSILLEHKKDTCDLDSAYLFLLVSLLKADLSRISSSFSAQTGNVGDWRPFHIRIVRWLNAVWNKKEKFWNKIVGKQTYSSFSTMQITNMTLKSHEGHNSLFLIYNFFWSSWLVNWSSCSLFLK